MSINPDAAEGGSKHSLATRLFHTGLALSIVTQLGTSLLMHGPDEEQAGDALFQVHRFAGLTATALALALWIIIVVRRRGTEMGMLFPWFSGARFSALFADIGAHMKALRRFRLPLHDGHAALPSAVHGLDLLLISAMAASGTVYFVQVAWGLHSAEPDGMLAMTVHLALANIVWVYLIAHAGLAVLQHLLRSMPLSEMWSLRA